jgi:hypothetical protein
MPIVRRGAILTDGAFRCPIPELRSNAPADVASAGYAGAVAFTRSGWPDIGRYEDAEILRRFGSV